MKSLYRCLAAFLLFLTPYSPCEALKSPHSHKHHPPFILYNWVKLRVTPSGFINRFGKGLPIGLEYNINQRIAILCDYSMPLYDYNKGAQNELYKKWVKQDVRLTIQLRYYFGQQDRAKWMFGAEGFGEHQEFDEEAGEYHNDHKNYKYGFANVQKTVLGSAVFIGGNVFITGNFCVEGRVGVGGKWVDAHRQNIRSMQQPVPINGFARTTEDQIKSSGLLVYVPLSLSFTYGFGRRRRHR